MRIHLKRPQKQSRSLPISFAASELLDGVKLADAVNEVLNDATVGSPPLVSLHSIPLLLAALASLSKLELVKSSPYDFITVPGLFSVLKHMPRLQDLTIDVCRILPAAQGTPLPTLPTALHLRRLVLSQAFPGWALLVRHSRGTLECLALGLRWNGLDYSSPLLMGDVPLSVLQNVRALRMDEQPDPAILAACAPTLESLTLHGIARDLALLQVCHVLRPQLRRLRVLYSEFTNARATDLAHALARLTVYSGLRALDVETDTGPDESQLRTGCPLVQLCGARYIALSLSSTRPIVEWECLEA